MSTTSFQLPHLIFIETEQYTALKVSPSKLGQIWKNKPENWGFVSLVCIISDMIYNLKQARKLQATLFRNYASLTDWLADGGEV